MKLSAADVNARLSAISGWSFQQDAISRTFTFPSFPDAVAFVTRLGFQAQEADHHPDLRVSYKRVTVEWSTHSEGGVTERDLEGARQSNTIAKTLGAA
jgi:4a-hydroxytetrahydrobiopterin dehydratase